MQRRCTAHELISQLQLAVTAFRLNVTAKNAITREGRDEIEHHVAVLATLLMDIQEEENDNE